MPTTTSSLPKLLTIQEAAKELRVCTKTVYGLVKNDTLPAIRIGRQLRISERTLRAYLLRNV
jgi:excisionase family DNA binding protein